MNSLGPDCCWCCVALGERDGELDPDHTHTVGECDWCDGPGRAFNPMPITRTGVPASASWLICRSSALRRAVSSSRWRPGSDRQGAFDAEA